MNEILYHKEQDIIIKVTIMSTKKLFSINCIFQSPQRYYDLVNNGIITKFYHNIDLEFKIWASAKLTKDEFIKELERFLGKGFEKNEDNLKAIAHYLI